MLVKLLGGIDLVCGITFLLLVVQVDVYTRILLLCAMFLFMKGLLVFTGDVLSGVDIVASLLLLSAVIFSIPVLVLWIFALALFAKGGASFL